MVLDFLKRIFASPEPVTALEDVGTGKQILRGVVKQDGDLVRSPLKGVTCVAFYYRAYYKAQARGKYVDRVIKDAEVYAPRFAIELQGGVVAVVPRKTGSFDTAEHRAVMGRGFTGFQAHEQVIRPGDRVAIRGRVSRDGEGFRIRPEQIDMLGSAGDDLPVRTGKKRRHRR